MPTHEPSLAELIDSPQFAWSVLESLPTEAVLVFDRDQRIVAAAGQVLRDRDFEPERVIGKLLSEVIAPSAYERYRPHYESALAGELTTFEAETEDGRNVYVSTFTPLRNDEGVVVGGVVFTRDLTDARRAQRRFEAAFDNAPSGVVLVSLDRRFIRVNQAICRILGRTEEELLGHSVSEFVHPDDVAIGERAAQSFEANPGSTVEMEERFLRPDGEIVWVYSSVAAVSGESGEVDYHVAHMQDITERRSAEERQLEATERFETAFADAPIGMALVGLDGRFERVNRALCEITGYPRERLLELTFQEITHPDDLHADLSSLEQLREGMIDRYSMEKRYFTASQNLIWVNLSVSMVRDAEGEPLHFISQIEDISDRKRLEEQLHWLADHDSLTRLWNRRRFDEELRRQISRCQRYAERAALLLIDLDDFKPVNDRHGHKAGDDLLVAIAEALKSRLRDTDSIARIGGDEFAVLAVNVSPDQAGAVATTLADVVADTEIQVEGESVGVHASVGVAPIDDAVDLDEDIFVRADRAMYRKKGQKASPEPART